MSWYVISIGQIPCYTKETDILLSDISGKIDTAAVLLFKVDFFQSDHCKSGLCVFLMSHTQEFCPLFLESSCQISANAVILHLLINDPDKKQGDQIWN